MAEKSSPKGKKADPQMAMTELLCQALETEIGGVEVYKTAIRCAQNEDLKKEWQEYLEQTENHVEILSNLMEVFEIDVDEETPGRAIVRMQAQALVEAMNTAAKTAPPGVAQIVAAECVVLAETKDHQNWELIAELAESLDGKQQDALLDAHEEVWSEENEHLYHNKGWARELWLESLNLGAVLPPPEEQKDVEDAVSAERVKKQRHNMIG